MSRDLFGFKDEPFSAYPDNKYFFSSIHHDKAITLLEYGLNSRKGFMLLTGLRGTGKSVTCNILKETVKDCNVSIVLKEARSSDKLIKEICKGFNLPADAEKDQLFGKLMEFFVDQYREGNNNLIIIDNAENIDDESLEMLNNFMEIEIEKCKLVQVILCGSPDLHDRLKNIGKQLGPKFTFTVELAPLSLKDTCDYVEHRIVTAMEAGDQHFFKKQSFAEIYNYSKGIPSEINRIAHKAIEIAKEKKTSKITPRYIKMAAARLYGVKVAAKTSMKPVYAFVVILIAVVGVYFYINSDHPVLEKVLPEKEVQVTESIPVEQSTVKEDLEVTEEPQKESEQIVSHESPVPEIIDDKPAGDSEKDDVVAQEEANVPEPVIVEEKPVKVVQPEVKEESEKVVVEEEEKIRYGCVTANSGLKMRAGASVSAELIDTAPKDFPIELLELSENKRWWKVSYQGKTGFMYAKFLKSVDSPEECSE
jgi:general secretion pathway protein A